MERREWENKIVEGRWCNADWLTEVELKWDERYIEFNCWVGLSVGGIYEHNWIVLV